MHRTFNFPRSADSTLLSSPFTNLPELHFLFVITQVQTVPAMLAGRCLFWGFPNWEQDPCCFMCILIFTRTVQSTFIVLPAYTFTSVFMGSVLSFHQCKNHKSSLMLHTGPSTSTYTIEMLPHSLGFIWMMALSSARHWFPVSPH